MTERVAVYFVASPLQYQVARQIADTVERDASRQILVWYKPGVASVVRAEQWDASTYMAWPRFEPLPGMFGRLRRLRANIRLVAGLVGHCQELVIHSAVFDTEAINYFLHALPRLAGARRWRARILPDGVLSLRRYPLSWSKRLMQCLRKLRQLVAPELRYRCFSGDRIGSEAAFCDRIYVLPGFPHGYPMEKVWQLSPLVAGAPEAIRGQPRRALVIGQPLASAGLLSGPECDRVAREIKDWLRAHESAEVDYKAHPKDPRRELFQPDYRVLEIDESLESHMSKHHYDLVAGVRSSALVFARQIYGPETRVRAFGLDAVRFKDQDERDVIVSLFRSQGLID